MRNRLLRILESCLFANLIGFVWLLSFVLLLLVLVFFFYKNIPTHNDSSENM